MKLILYNANFFKIGGLETFVRNFCKRMNKYYEITVLYESADGGKVNEISQYAEMKKYENGDEYECDICVWASAWGKRPIDKIHAKGVEVNGKKIKHAQMIHADWEEVKRRNGTPFPVQDGIDLYIAVGEECGKAFKRQTGLDYIVIHNLLDLDIKPKKILKLVTASRISPEKGFERMAEMARMMTEAEIPFIWDIYGDWTGSDYVKKIKSMFAKYPNCIFHGSKVPLYDEMAGADYVVQVSNTEAFCYTIYEALQLGTAVIATNFKSAFEQVQEGETGYILDMDLKNFDPKKIYEKVPRGKVFKEFSTEETWLKAIGTPKKKPKKYVRALYDGICQLDSFDDLFFNKHFTKGDLIQGMPLHRYDHLLKKGYIKPAIEPSEKK